MPLKATKTRVLIGLLLMAFAAVFASELNGADADVLGIGSPTSSLSSCEAADGLNSIVLSFDAPIIKGVNCSKELYELIAAIIKDKASMLENKINEQGALYSVSFNSSGVQLGLFYFKSLNEAVSILKEISAKLAAGLNADFLGRRGLLPADYLHCIAESGGYFNLDSQPRVSLYLSGEAAEQKSLIEQELLALNDAYADIKSTVLCGKTVIEAVGPFAVSVFKWNQASSSAVCSAKYYAESFLRFMPEESESSYEIIYNRGSVFLFTYISGTEGFLSKFIRPFKSFNALNFSDKLNNSQGEFISAFGKIMQNDSRDLIKHRLYCAWAEHCSIKADEDLKILPPDERFFNVALPEAWRHEFCYEEAYTPLFGAVCSDDKSGLCEIAVSFYFAEKTNALFAFNMLNENLAQNRAISIKRQSDNGFSVSFSCERDGASEALSAFKNDFYSLLSEKKLNYLTSNAKIAVSAVSDMLPFELCGLLKEAWGAKPDNNASRLVWLNSAGEGNVLRLESADKNAALNRWRLLSSNNRGKAELVSVLLVNGFKIKSFDFKPE